MLAARLIGSCSAHHFKRDISLHFPLEVAYQQWQTKGAIPLPIERKATLMVQNQICFSSLRPPYEKTRGCSSDALVECEYLT